jgi:hypothetical protein
MKQTHSPWKALAKGQNHPSQQLVSKGFPSGIKALYNPKDGAVE